MYEGPIGIISFPGTIRDLHKKWSPPEYVVELWQTGCKVRYEGHERFLEQKNEVLEAYEEIEEREKKNGENNEED